jgi:hypothetical protein
MQTEHQAGLILLFDGEVAEKIFDRDEHNQTGILTPASYLIPSFPAFRPVVFGNS